MSARAASPVPHRHRRPSLKRPLRRVILRAAGLSALLAWVGLLGWASFDDTAMGSSGPYMIVGTVGSCLLVAIVIATAAAHEGLRTIIAGLLAAVLAAAAGWGLYASMPDAGPSQFISHRAGVAALGYVFGVLGGGLLALSELAVEGYADGRRRVPKGLRRGVSVLTCAIVFTCAAALAPGMQRWVELANEDVRTAGAGAGSEEEPGLASVRRFLDTPYGLLRVDHPGEVTPQAVTLLEPENGAVVWYHRRWNWHASQPPVLSHSTHLTAITGPRADDPRDHQTRVLRTDTGGEVATVGFRGAPGRLLAVDDDLLLYTGERDQVFTAYDFAGKRRWATRVPAGCTGAAARIAAGRLVVLAECMPAPERLKARDHVLAFDVATGRPVWDALVDHRAVVEPESFLVTDETVVIDSRIEQRVSDGPFSARRFEHKLIAYDLADGSIRWRQREQLMGSTHSSACGGTLHLSQPTVSEAAGEEGAAGPRASVQASQRRTVQLIECFAAGRDSEGSRIGVMAYDLDSGEHLYRRSVPLGLTPLDPAVARGWATVLPDNRAVVATDRSLDRSEPDCRLFALAEGETTPIDLSDRDLPPEWCRDAQLTSAAAGVAVSYIDREGARSLFLID